MVTLIPSFIPIADLPLETAVKKFSHHKGFLHTAGSILCSVTWHAWIEYVSRKEHRYDP